MPFLRLFALFALTLAASCRSNPVAPEGALLGRFGASTSELVLTATEVRLRGGCDELVGQGALVVDPLGRFLHTLRSLSTIRPGGLYVIRGRVEGDVLRGEMISILVESSTTSPITYTRNVTPQLGGIACTT